MEVWMKALGTACEMQRSNNRTSFYLAFIFHYKSIRVEANFLYLFCDDTWMESCIEKFGMGNFVVGNSKQFKHPLKTTPVKAIDELKDW